MISFKLNPHPDHTPKTCQTIVTVDDESQYFETPIKHNHSATAPITHFLLGDYTIKCQHNTTTHTKGQKIPPSGKGHIYFKLTGKMTMQQSVKNLGHWLN